MSDPPTLEDFTPRVGERFTARDAQGGALALELVAAVPTAAGADERRPRAPFSLLFHGPAEPVWPQAIYRFEHPDMGALEIFIVPIGPAGDAMRYEAVFG